MPHHRARLTARGRREVVRRVIEHGDTFAQAAAWANVSKSTVHGWVTRWRTASAADRASLAFLQERSSRPHRSPGRVPAEEERRICELRERTGWSPRRLADDVLPGLCAAGRIVIERDGEVERISWDEGPPWRFVVEVGPAEGLQRSLGRHVPGTHPARRTAGMGQRQGKDRAGRQS